MKYSYLFLLIILISSCKQKNGEPAVIPPVELQKMPDGIVGFSVKGVDKSGISFTNLNMPYNNPSWIQVNLPVNYNYGDKITLHFTMKTGYGIGFRQDTRIDSDSITLSYEGRYFMMHILTPENKISGQIYLYVNPGKPLEALPIGEPYQLTINPGFILARVPVKNWGTNYYLDDSLKNEVYGGIARLKNITTGHVEIAKAVFEELDEGFISVLIPDTIDAGQYEMTLVRNNRSVLVPDRVNVKYGAPAIRSEVFFNQNSFLDKGYSITYQGYNLTPDHHYEMTLTNDLMETTRIPLFPKNHIELQANLPSAMLQGTYQVMLYIDSSPVKYWNELTGVNLIFLRENADQPAIWLLSQRSQVFNGLSGKLYRPAISFNRNEDIILHAESRPHILTKGTQVSKLVLKRVDADGTYELPLSDSTAPAILTFFPQFRITDDIPSGNYEVRLSVQEKNEIKPRISGPYYRMITIQ